MFDFPASPSEGATYTPSGGPTYVFNSPKWVVSGGSFRLLKRVDVSSAVAQVDIQSIPSDINDLKFTFDLAPVTTTNSLLLQMYDNTGTLDTTAGRYAWALSQVYSGIASAGSPLGYGSATTALANGVWLNTPVAGASVGISTGIRGSGTIPNIRAVRFKSVDFQSNYLDDGPTHARVIAGSGYRALAGLISGFRLSFASGNIASGAFSVWGSP